MPILLGANTPQIHRKYNILGATIPDDTFESSIQEGSGCGDGNCIPPTIEHFANTPFETHELSINEYECSGDESCAGSGEDRMCKVDCFELTCDGDGQPTPKYTWYRDNQPVSSETGNVKLSNNNKSLKLLVERSGTENKMLGDNDVGNYYCEAVNAVGKAKSEVLYITHDTVRNPSLSPKVTDPGSGNLVEYFSEETVTCSVESGESPYYINWTQNGNMVMNLKNVRLIDNNETLVIEKFDTSSVGNYACNVSNEHGYDYHNLALRILRKQPSWTYQQETHKNAHTGQESLELSCAADGYPLPNVTWKFRNKTDSEYTDICTSVQYNKSLTNTCKKIKAENRTVGNKVMSNLIIEPADVGNAGMYQCQATNDQGSILGNICCLSNTKLLEYNTNINKTEYSNNLSLISYN